MGEPSPLTGTLISLGLLSQEDVNEAVARQLIFGGELETVLLETGRIQEADLLRGLAQLTTLSPAEEGPLPIDVASTLRTRELVPDAIIGRTADGLFLYLRSALEGRELNRVASLLDEPFESRVTTALRLEEATCFLDDTPLPDRSRKVIEQTGRILNREFAPRPSTHPSVLPASHPPRSSEATHALDTPPVESAGANLETLAGAEEALRPPPIARALGNLEPSPMEIVELRSVPTSEETAPPPADYEEVRLSVGPPAASPDSVRPESRRQGSEAPSYSHRQAEQDLEQCRDRDRIVQVLLDYCSQFFTYTAVFAVQSHEARGLSSRGPGADPDRLLNLRVPLDLPSAFGKVRDTGVHRVARLRASGVEGGIVRDLKRPAGRAVLLIPICLRGRPLLLVWGDEGDEDVDIERSAPALLVTSAAERAIEKVLIERKRASRVMSPHESESPAAPDPDASSSAAKNVSWSRPAGHAAGEEPGNAAPEGEWGPLPSGGGLGGQTTRLGISLPPARPPARPQPKATQEVRDPPATKSGMSIPPAGLLSERPSRPPPIDDGPENDGPRQPASASPHQVAGVAKRSLSDPGIQDERRTPSEFPSDHPKTIKGFPENVALLRREPAPSVPSSPPPRVPEPLLSRRIVPLAGGDTDRAARESARTDEGDASTEASAEASPPASPDSSAGGPSTHPNLNQEAVEGVVAPDDETGSVERADAGDAASDSAAIAEEEEPLSGKRRSTSPPASDSVASDSAASLPPSSGGHQTLVSRSNLPPAHRGNAPSGGRLEGAKEFERVTVSYEDLVDRYLAGEDELLQKLEDGGESAVGALITRFPGPTREPRDGTENASACGPVLRALAALGARATPFVTVRTADEDPTVRRWAVALLGELPGREAARSIAERLLDDAAVVRRAALMSARRVQDDILTRRALRARLEEMMRDQKLGSEDRVAAIEAVADIREHLSIPTLLTLLGDGDSHLARQAKWALSVLTRQDFAGDIEAWKTFWQEHRNEPREEWLIFALLQEDSDLKRAAVEELSLLLGTQLELPLDEAEIQALRERVKSRSRGMR